MKLTKEVLFGSTKAVAVWSASLGALGGAAASAAVAMKYFEKKYAAIAEEEIKQAQTFYSRYNKTGDFATPEGAAAVLLGPDEALVVGGAEAMLEYQGDPDPSFLKYVKKSLEEGSPAEELDLIEVSKNIFTDSPEAVAELDPDNRDPERPYVISYEEFREFAEEDEQMVLTFFEVDGILIDDKDQVVMDEDSLVGDDNLVDKWGMGSHNNDIVYVRNERIQTCFEITRSKRSYAQDAGFIEHSDHRRPRRFRGDDD